MAAPLVDYPGAGNEYFLSAFDSEKNGQSTPQESLERQKNDFLMIY